MSIQSKQQRCNNSNKQQIIVVGCAADGAGGDGDGDGNALTDLMKQISLNDKHVNVAATDGFQPKHPVKILSNPNRQQHKTDVATTNNKTPITILKNPNRQMTKDGFKQVEKPIKILSNPNRQIQQTKTAVTQINDGQLQQSSIAEGTNAKRSRQKKKWSGLEHYVAMDCEMVGVGLNGQDDMLARVSIVNRNGDVLLDKFVKPLQTVVDYRTSISGVRPHDMENGDDFFKVQDEVVDILQGKILVGHAIRNDLSVLHIKHPFTNIRDTSRYKPLSRLVSNGRTPSLKRLTLAVLGMEIQTGEHNSVEDARAAMDIYNRLCVDWEQYLQCHGGRYR